jgi:hypothetical protein
MENSDAVGDALLYAAASSTFEDYDNGFGEPIRLRRSANSFHERSGCSWSIAPPPRRPRPNHVRRIDKKHYPGLADPLLGAPPSIYLDCRRPPWWLVVDQVSVR